MNYLAEECHLYFFLLIVHKYIVTFVNIFIIQIYSVDNCWEKLFVCRLLGSILLWPFNSKNLSRLLIRDKLKISVTTDGVLKRDQYTAVLISKSPFLRTNSTISSVTWEKKQRHVKYLSCRLWMAHIVYANKFLQEKGCLTVCSAEK